MVTIYLVKCYNKYWGSTNDSHLVCAYFNEKDALEHCRLFEDEPLYKYFVAKVECYDHLKGFGE